MTPHGSYPLQPEVYTSDIVLTITNINDKTIFLSRVWRAFCCFQLDLGRHSTQVPYFSIIITIILYYFSILIQSRTSVTNHYDFTTPLSLSLLLLLRSLESQLVLIYNQSYVSLKLICILTSILINTHTYTYTHTRHPIMLWPRIKSRSYHRPTHLLKYLWWYIYAYCYYWYWHWYLY